MSGWTFDAYMWKLERNGGAILRCRLQHTGAANAVQYSICGPVQCLGPFLAPTTGSSTPTGCPQEECPEELWTEFRV